MDELTRLLGLGAPPAYIEAYDISNIGAGTIVGGMVVFEGGRPQKKILPQIQDENPADSRRLCQYAGNAFRRFARYEEEKSSGEGFGRLPDLILLDGGKAM